MHEITVQEEYKCSTHILCRFITYFLLIFVYYATPAYCNGSYSTCSRGISSVPSNIRIPIEAASTNSHGKYILVFDTHVVFEWC